MPEYNLPNDPSLEHLKKEAKAFKQAHPGLQLTEAQFAVARRYGFASWAKLRAHLDVVARYIWRPDDTAPSDDDATRLLQLGCLTYSDEEPSNWTPAADLLRAQPQLSAASIHAAAATGDIDAARAILDRDATAVAAKGGPYNWEPLMYAAYARIPGRNTLIVARLLLEYGADPNVGYLWHGLPSPFTALTGAFGGGEGDQPKHPESLAFARALLEAGADANDSQTLYNRGLIGWDIDAPEHVELLLEFGLGRGDGGPWHARLGSAHPAPKELLEDELLHAAAMNCPRWAELVLAAGVDVNGLGTRHPVREGATAWEFAVRNGNTAIVARLDAAGARPPTPDPALEFLGACMNGDRAAIDPAVAPAAIARRPHHITSAADRRRLDGVLLMAEVGFDVNERDRFHPHHATALHYAAFNGDMAMVQALVNLDADRTLEDTSFHATPAGWADHAGHRAIAEFLAVVE